MSEYILLYMLLSVINKLYLVSLALLSWGFEHPCHIVVGGFDRIPYIQLWFVKCFETSLADSPIYLVSWYVLQYSENQNRFFMWQTFVINVRIAE